MRASGALAAEASRALWAPSKCWPRATLTCDNPSRRAQRQFCRLAIALATFIIPAGRHNRTGLAAPAFLVACRAGARVTNRHGYPSKQA